MKKLLIAVVLLCGCDTETSIHRQLVVDSVRMDGDSCEALSLNWSSNVSDHWLHVPCPCSTHPGDTITFNYPRE